ncbi:class I SAM-dependent methyltransferase [Bradyrhizobium sp. ORS 375]|uniref:class I SAM-dependent methyltransferase n=1 Tax=Bradyrhizobium sp. (strain ORS 375) TaxID=566679 RepID=UPI001FCAD1BE|nr:class I SAM-dependent methyltransferase [Bradyrhizobium sp. ORS 375]
MLDELPKGGVVAEIGVASGSFSREIIERLQPRKLHLVDAWNDDRFAGGLSVVQETFSAAIATGMVEINRSTSVEALSRFPDGYFDFVYIDTTHAYDLTLQELNLCLPKMKPAGLIGGHDFCSGNIVAPHVYGVIQATSKFCRERDWVYKYISIDPDTYFSFCIERALL